MLHGTLGTSGGGANQSNQSVCEFSLFLEEKIQIHKVIYIYGYYIFLIWYIVWVSIKRVQATVILKNYWFQINISKSYTYRGV